MDEPTAKLIAERGIWLSTQAFPDEMADAFPPGSQERAKVSGHVPRSGAGKGSVVVSFGVSSSGGLSYARIAKSSGNAAIDRSVLAGVRASSPFPPPPAGASPAQLRFSVSFHFK
jgi:protein TonB